MRHLRHTLIICLGILFGATALTSADAQLRWGVRAGADFSKFPTTPQEFTSDFYTGFHAGPTVELGLPLDFSIDASVLFSQRNVGLTMEETDVKDILKTKYITLPVNVKYDLISVPLVDLMVIAGPQFNFMLSNNLDDLSADVTKIQDIEAKKMSMGINIGLGVRVMQFLQVSALYNATLSNDYTFTSLKQTTTDVFNAKTNGFLIQAAVLF
jgi:hypothetical protein